MNPLEKHMSWIRDELADAVRESPTPTIPAYRERPPAQRPTTRRGTLILAAAATATVVMGSAILALQLQSQSPVKPEGPTGAPASTWESTGVPWVDGDHVHFGEATMRQPNSLMSIAATRSAAVVLHGASSVEHSEATNRVTALYADGSEKLLDTNVLGYPIGDPLGEIVAWSTKGSREGDTTVTAFDTANRRVVGDASVPSGFRVFAVDRETVYLSDLYGTTMVWNPSTGGAPQPFAQAAPGIVTDASSERVIVAQGEQTVLLRQNGEVAQQFDKVYLGTFSPSGEYASLTGQEELLVWDVAPAREIALKLPAGKSGIGRAHV